MYKPDFSAMEKKQNNVIFFLLEHSWLESKGFLLPDTLLMSAILGTINSLQGTHKGSIPTFPKDISAK